MTPKHSIEKDEIYESLSAHVQKWIKSQEGPWKSFREIQRIVIPQLLKSFKSGKTSDFLVSAPTATGKTEAVFLPLASLLSETGDATTAKQVILYVCPLNALIDQQAKRLKGIFPQDYPIIPWHGDAPQGAKKKFKENPSGLVIITPESLEAQFCNHGSEISFLYNNLLCIVIDELHSFFNVPRGYQLISLLTRLEEVLGERIVPRIALSATFDSSIQNAARKFLRPGKETKFTFCRDSHTVRKLNFHFRGFARSREKSDSLEIQDTTNSTIALQIFKDFSEIAGKKIRNEKAKGLLFVNSRQQAEFFSQRLMQIAKEKKSELNFIPHHGSLSSDAKNLAIESIRNPNKSVVIVCTSTLELGIDIGAITQVGQIDPGSTVASLQQRLGRSGRGHGDLSKLYLYIREQDREYSNSILSKLHLAAFQALAQVTLVEEGKFESPDPKPAHLSTLMQQILSLVKQKENIPLESLRSILIENGPFKTLNADVDRSGHFQLMINQLRNIDFINTRSGSIDNVVLGASGKGYIERLKQGFYAAFQSGRAYGIFYNEQQLGSVPSTSSIRTGDDIIFSGRLWTILNVNHQMNVIRVTPSARGQAPSFPGEPIAPSEEVIERMLMLYQKGKLNLSTAYSFDKEIKELFDEGLSIFKKNNLKSAKIIKEGDSIIIFPWVAERKQNSLILAFRYWGLQALPAKIAILIENSSIDEVKSVIKKISLSSKKGDISWAEKTLPSPTEAARDAGNLLIDKHDKYLSSYLQRWNYASAKIDLDAVISVCGQLLK